MIDGLGEDDYLAWNYDFFRVHRVIPEIAEPLRGAYKLKDLQVTSLDNNPSFGRSILASLMVRMYTALRIDIDDPKDILVNPGEKTLTTLAQHCHTSARQQPTTLGG